MIRIKSLINQLLVIKRIIWFNYCYEVSQLKLPLKQSTNQAWPLSTTRKSVFIGVGCMYLRTMRTYSPKVSRWQQKAIHLTKRLIERQSPKIFSRKSTKWRLCKYQGKSKHYFFFINLYHLTFILVSNGRHCPIGYY